MRRCDQNAGDGNMNFKKEELICGSCCAKKFSVTQKCKKHGTDYMYTNIINNANLFIVNINVNSVVMLLHVRFWLYLYLYYLGFCWGTTHFCDECHNRQVKDQSITKMAKSDLPKCKG